MIEMTYAEAFRLYKAVLETISVACKGDTVPNTSVNGHMFSYLSKSGVVALRLPEEAREAFLRKHKTVLCRQYGVVQKEYVEIPGKLLEKTSQLKPYFAASFRYVSFLKPRLAKVVKN